MDNKILSILHIIINRTKYWGRDVTKFESVSIQTKNYLLIKICLKLETFKLDDQNLERDMINFYMLNEEC